MFVSHCTSVKGDMSFFYWYKIVDYKRAMWELVRFYCEHDVREGCLSLVLLRSPFQNISSD